MKGERDPVKNPTGDASTGCRRFAGEACNDDRLNEPFGVAGQLDPTSLPHPPEREILGDSGHSIV